MSFITRTPLFAKPIGPRFLLLGSLFDLILLGTVWVAWLSAAGLSAFMSGAPSVSASPLTFKAFAGFGVYGVRVAMFIAFSRRNRKPQVAEWMVTLAGLALAAFFAVFGLPLLHGYARLQGYHYCGIPGPRGSDLVFARADQRCDQASGPQ